MYIADPKCQVPSLFTCVRNVSLFGGCISACYRNTYKHTHIYICVFLSCDEPRPVNKQLEL